MYCTEFNCKLWNKSERCLISFPEDQFLFAHISRWRKEGNVLFYLRLYGVRHMVKDHSDREETCCRHMDYSFQLAARVRLYASRYIKDNTYHSLCYTSHEALAETRNSSMGPPWRNDPTTHRTMSGRPYHRTTSRSTIISRRKRIF